MTDMRKTLLIATVCLGFAALFLIDRWQVQQFRSEKASELDATLQLCRTRLENSILTRFNALESLASLFILHPGTSPSEFSHFASLVMEFNPPIRAIQYADSGTRVTYVYPPKGNEITIKKPMTLLTDPTRGPYVQKAIQNKSATLQGPFELRQGGLGVVLRFPIFKEMNFIGLSIGVCDVAMLISEALDNLSLDQFVLSLEDHQGKVFWRSGSMPADFHQKSFPVADTTWTISANWVHSPSPPYLSRLLIWLFGTGFLLSAFYLIRNSWKHEHRLEALVSQRTSDLSLSNKALQKSQERFEIAMKFANQGLFDWDLETDQIYYSPEWKGLLGYEVHEIENRISEWKRLTKAEDVKAALDMLNEVLEGKRDRFEKEFKMRHKDGRWVDILSRGNVIFNEAGEGMRVVGTHLDISVRKHDEKNLRKAHAAAKRQNITFSAINRLFQEAMDCRSSTEVAKVCLSIAEETTGSRYGSVAEVNSRDRFNTLALSNPGWEHCQMAELDPTSIQDMEIRGIWQAALKSENGLIVNDPSNHPASVGLPAGHPPLSCFLGVPFHHKNFNGLIGVANRDGGYTDTDREILQALSLAFAEVINSKRAEEALRESEKKYRLSMEVTNDGLWDWNLRTGKVYFSPSWGKIIGETDLDQIYDTWATRIHPKDKRNVLLSLQNHLKGETDYWHKEHRLKTKTGEWKWVLGRGRVVAKDEDAQPLRMVGTITDMTYIKQVEAKLHQSQKMESIGNLAGGIAHDFNNILASIIGFTELALDDVESGSETEDKLQEVLTAGNRARDLTKQILAFARQSEEQVKPVRVDKIVEEVLKFIRSSIPTSIEIKQFLESDSLIMANSTQIHQILMNLCTNAAQAMEDGGGCLEVKMANVTIGGKTQGRKLSLVNGPYIEIKVTDTGVGIEPEITDSIFEPYFTTKGIGEGTGMGLAVVHGIVESYSGKITVESKLGKGTTFTIYLPITIKRSDHTLTTSEDLPTGNERILLIDDEPAISKMSSQVLARLGYSMTTQQSSVAALELFRSAPHNFDMVITDMTMPDMTGDMLAINMMKIRPDIPVVLCTGYSKKVSEKSAAAIGIKALAYKPIEKADLAKTVRKVLDSMKAKAQT